ncbi:MAG: tetratricopeptide repeat protein [Bacteroidetes bacterium]|jgi:tetratricopeptide (TPR) repeat protein|nr:tetratricopeptide repeat protein [Bacteroidota bacterium]
MARRKKDSEDTLVNLLEVRNSLKDTVEKYQNVILGVVLGLVILVGGYILYQNVILAPKEKSAAEAMFQAQFQFERDSFTRALANPGGGYEGFLDIIDNYSGTDAANGAQYYAAVSYLYLNEFEEALYHIEKFDPDGKVTKMMKQGILGDIYTEQSQWEQAIKAYQKACSYENELLTPYYLNKLALLQDKQNMADAARETYQRIKTEFPDSQEANAATKYLALQN